MIKINTARDRQVLGIGEWKMVFEANNPKIRSNPFHPFHPFSILPLWLNKDEGKRMNVVVKLNPSSKYASILRIEKP